MISEAINRQLEKAHRDGSRIDSVEMSRIAFQLLLDEVGAEDLIKQRRGRTIWAFGKSIPISLNENWYDTWMLVMNNGDYYQPGVIEA